ncbi:MAG: hypothetical protein ACK4MM_00810, partial [Fervidobacterium sp.]
LTEVVVPVKGITLTVRSFEKECVVHLGGHEFTSEGSLKDVTTIQANGAIITIVPSKSSI